MKDYSIEPFVHKGHFCPIKSTVLQKMKRQIQISLLILGLCAIACGQVQDHEAGGNLESKAFIESMEIKGISSKNTPADIFRLVEKKIKKSEYEEAAMAFIIAMSYGQYDAARVEDTTAHQAITVLRMNLFSGLKEKDVEKFQEVLGEMIEDSELILVTLKNLGEPVYHPRYMIQHGMGTFLGNKSKDGIVEGFDGEKSWQTILAQFSKS